MLAKKKIFKQKILKILIKKKKKEMIYLIMLIQN